MCSEKLVYRIDTKLSKLKNNIEMEDRRVTNEIESYEDFLTQLDSIRRTSQMATPVTAITPIKNQSKDSTRAEIRESYESTVMAVPHFSEDYDESFFEHLTAEFGPELAAMIQGIDNVDEKHISIIESNIKTAINERENLLETINTERESIETISPELKEISSEVNSIGNVDFQCKDFGSLEAYWFRLNTIKSTCNTIASSRQTTIRSLNRDIGTISSKISFIEYLYNDIQEQYPILASIGLITQELLACQTDIEKQITTVSI